MGKPLATEPAEHEQRPHLGPYRIIRPLGPGRLSARHLAVHDRDQTSHIAHEFVCRDRAEQRRFLLAFERLSELAHPHILPVQQFALGHAHDAWLLTPYTGNQDGLVTLASLQTAKGGRMPPPEAERALTQILSAVASAHARGHHHGPIAPEDVLVDRHGRVCLALYGLGRLLAGLEGRRDASPPANAEVVRDEVRSVVELGYRLLTGLSAEEPRIPAGRLVRRLEGRWDAWFDAGLDPLGGFATAEEASAALASIRRDAGARLPVVSMRGVLGRVRSALRPGL